MLLGWSLSISVVGAMAWLVFGVMMLAVFASVHHAELIAHRIGEPFGTLVLALAVTVIETALILSVMMTDGAKSAALPRDTIYSAVMIICNGVVGFSLLLGGLHHKEQMFRIEGTGSGFAALVTLSILVLIMPLYTISSPEGTYTDPQLIFVAVSSLALWLVFVFIQTIRHRDYFLPGVGEEDESVHAHPPSSQQAWMSFVLMLISLISVVGFAKLLSPSIQTLVTIYKAPQATVGIVIAMIVLLPETWAALRAAKANRLQTSMNLAIGSALASIGLTIPLVVVFCVLFHRDLMLGLEMKDVVLLCLTFLVGSITLASGRTNVMQGAIHLVLFGAFLFLTLVP
ncbi:MAG: ionic transporter y4hA [Betaproteobacteria bacterium]|nr:ionic transporter y4hA [Betaproteobacteria bacterium]